MSMPYYVSPEQVMKDRAEYAQKGIARGRSLVATTYDAGIAMVAENPSRSLHKISETPRASLSAAKTSMPARWPISTPSTWATSSPMR
jgi:proteasome alpha subunit